MKTGDIVTIHALHADGQWYRRWQATVEAIDAACIVTYNPPNSTVEDVGRPTRILPYAIRNYYWYDKFYNLLEVIAADGSLVQIYVNVASPPQLVEGGFVFTDHELDVLMPVGEPARIVDEDEFEAAITRYGYTPHFVARCRVATEEARVLAEQWQPLGH